jgi:hypothetical protein
MDKNWKDKLTAEIKKTRRSLLRIGTVAMSRDNLWQVVKIPQDGGPVGTNAAFVARAEFDNIIDNNKTLKGFTTL